jgi:hypothetical protein
MDGLIPMILPLTGDVRMVPRVSVPKVAKDRPSTKATSEPLDDPYG